ncbi:hypothetical protein OG218_00195 [Kineococcus sp. NBC_00420]|uniref:hypothetical protein n=1 Tax=Kineococcus sp. NBC_00420 TaxID=2903564 RepID=UPI002E1EC238
MKRGHRTDLLATAAALVLLTAACSSTGEGDDIPTQQPDTTIVSYWTEHPELAPTFLQTSTVLLDEEHTGSHTFVLPDTSSFAEVTVGVSCGDAYEGRPWNAGFGDEHTVWATQVNSGCGGSGANLGTYKTAQVGVPTRLYVMVDDDTRYSVGVWGATPPSELPTVVAVDPSPSSAPS